MIIFAVSRRHSYDVRFAPIGVVDEKLGPPTQMAVFTRNTDSEAKAASSIAATRGVEPAVADVEEGAS